MDSPLACPSNIYGDDRFDLNSADSDRFPKTWTVLHVTVEIIPGDATREQCASVQDKAQARPP